MPASPYCTSDVEQLSVVNRPRNVYTILSATLALPIFRAW